ncbi:hypothetical protein D3C72_2434160 [compost metagenome]
MESCVGSALPAADDPDAGGCEAGKPEAGKAEAAGAAVETAVCARASRSAKAPLPGPPKAEVSSKKAIARMATRRRRADMGRSS